MICSRGVFFLSYLTHEFHPVEARSVKLDLYILNILQSACANGETSRNCKLIIAPFSDPFLCQACVIGPINFYCFNFFLLLGPRFCIDVMFAIVTIKKMFRIEFWGTFMISLSSKFRISPVIC